MDAVRLRPRLRFAPVLEWVVAASFLAATVGVGGMIVSELQPNPVPVAAAAEPPAIASVPAAVPERAVSVPILPFLDGKDVKIGESFSAVAARLGRSAEVGRQEVDRGSLGERLTRFYDYAGSRFILVFEPFERNGESRVAAIYLP
jgi:hypothetical protein